VRPFRRRGDELVARLVDAEADIVGLLLDQLEQLLAADPADSGGDPVMERLLPPGHASDPELAAEFRDLTEAGLRSGKSDDLATVRATLPPQGGELRLDDEQARAWLRTTNDLRLALGTRLGVSAETEPPEDPTDEEGSQLVDALAAGRGGRR
jgi:hypothetical protein